MKYFKTLGFAAVAATALMAFVGVASATTLTSPAGTTYTSTVKFTSTNISWHGSFITTTCTHSSMEGKAESHGSAQTVDIKGSSLIYKDCNYEITVLKKGVISIHSGGRVTISGSEIVIHGSSGECIYTTNATDIGQFTGGTPAKIDVDSVAIPRTGGSFFCGSSAEMTGSYTITTPGTLLVD